MIITKYVLISRLVEVLAYTVNIQILHISYGLSNTNNQISFLTFIIFEGFNTNNKITAFFGLKSSHLEDVSGHILVLDPDLSLSLVQRLAALQDKRNPVPPEFKKRLKYTFSHGLQHWCTDYI